MALSGDAMVSQLKDYTPETLRNLAGMMANGGSTRPIVIPEGDDDHSLIETGFPDAFELRHLKGGKLESLELAMLLQDSGLENARVLMDRDLDGVLDEQRQLPACVILTEAHDTTMDVLVSSPSVLNEVVFRVDASRMRRLDQSERKQQIEETVRRAVETVFAVTCVRISNVRLGLGFSFQNFPYVKLVKADGRRLEIAVDLISRRGDRGGGVGENHEMPLDVLESALEAWDQFSHKKMSLVGDHDFIKTLALLLDGGWGEQKLRTLLYAVLSKEDVLRCHWGQQLEEFRVGFASRAERRFSESIKN